MNDRIQSLSVLLVSSFEKSKSFYQDILGCEVTDWWALRNDSLKLGLKLIESPDQEAVTPNQARLTNDKKIVWDVYAYADNFEALDQLYNEWKDKGAQIAQEPETTENDWGLWKEFAISDPDGYIIGIGSAKKN